MTATALRVADNTPARDGWRLLRLDAPPDGPALAPGHWLTLARGPVQAALPVYRASAREGWWAALLPPDHRFAGVERGVALDLVGRHGEPLPAPDGNTLMLGVGPGVGPILGLCETAAQRPLFVALGDAAGLPVRLVPSRFVVDTLPPEVMAGVAPLESAGIPARAAVPGDRPGCHDGDAVELLRCYVTAIPAADRARLGLIAATPWRSLATWRAELDGLFRTVRLMELPEVSGPPRPASG